MNVSTRYGLIGLTALAVLSATHWIRGQHWTNGFLASYVLGVLPNVAAAVAMPFVATAIWADHKPGRTASAARMCFAIAASGSCAGLVAWEIVQRGSRRLVFDVHDIAATVIGTGIAFAAFVLVTPRRGVGS